jgi:hypothetical protein
LSLQLGIPFQQFPVEVRVYYYFQIGMYISLMYSLTSDTKRKDFTEVVEDPSTRNMSDTLFCLGDDPPRRDDTVDIFLVVVG